MAGNAAFPGRLTASTATSGNCFCLIQSIWLLPSTTQPELSSRLPHPSCGFCGKNDFSVTAAPGWQDRASRGHISPGESPFSAGATAPVLGKQPPCLGGPPNTSPDGAENLRRDFRLHPSGQHLEDYSIYCVHLTSLPVLSPLCLKGLPAKARWSPTPARLWPAALARSREAAAHSCPSFPRGT